MLRVVGEQEGRGVGLTRGMAGRTKGKKEGKKKERKEGRRGREHVVRYADNPKPAALFFMLCLDLLGYFFFPSEMKNEFLGFALPEGPKTREVPLSPLSDGGRRVLGFL